MARTLDGTDDQIHFGSDAATDNLAQYTAMALVRITANVTDQRQILTKFTSGYQGKLYLFAVGNGGGNNKIASYISGGTAMYSESVSGILAVNTWKVIFATWEGHPGGAGPGIAPKLYACTLGGTLAELSYAAQNTGDVTPPDSDASATLRYGGWDPPDAVFFGGGLADFGLWNYVMDFSDMSEIGAGKSPEFFPTGLVKSSRITGNDSPEIDFVGGTNGTVVGTTFLTHPSVLYPSVGGFNPVWAAAANQ